MTSLEEMLVTKASESSESVPFKPDTSNTVRMYGRVVSPNLLKRTHSGWVSRPQDGWRATTCIKMNAVTSESIWKERTWLSFTVTVHFIGYTFSDWHRRYPSRLCAWNKFAFCMRQVWIGNELCDSSDLRSKRASLWLDSLYTLCRLACSRLADRYHDLVIAELPLCTSVDSKEAWVGGLIHKDRPQSPSRANFRMGPPLTIFRNSSICA